jgi:hypothetical protein
MRRIAPSVLLLALSTSTAHALPPRPEPAPLRPILAALADEQPARRAAALAALGPTSDPLLFDVVVADAEDARSPTRAASIAALARMGLPSTPTRTRLLIDVLTAAARDPNAETAEAAVEALHTFPFPEVTATLAQLADDPSAPPLARQAAARPIDAEAARAVLSRWAAQLAKGSSPPLEAALGPRCGGARPPETCTLELALVTLASRARSSWPNALDAIVSRREAALAPFVAAFARRRPGEVALLERAAAGLANAAPTGDPMTRRALLALVRHSTRAVRGAAIRAVGAQLEPLAAPEAPPLARALVDATLGEADAALTRALEALVQRLPAEPVLAALADTPRARPTDALVARLARTRTGTAADALLVALLSETRDRGLVARLGVELGARPSAAATVLAAVDRAPERLVPVLAALEPPGTSARALAIAERGEVDASTLAQAIELALRDPGARAPMLALLAAPDAPRRRAALDATRSFHGDDVVAALERAVLRAPDDDALRARLVDEAPELRAEALVALAARPELAAHRGALLAAIGPVARPGLAARLVDVPAAHAAAALPTLEAQPFDEAVPALARFAARDELDAELRGAAVDAIAARSGAPDAHAARISALAGLAHVEDLGLRTRVRGHLHALAPDVYPSWDPYGRIPLVIAASGFGGSMLALAADVADANLSPAFTVGAGLVLGGATPFLLTLGETVSLGDAAFFTTQAAWGTALGLGLGNLVDADDRGTRWATLLGQLGGVTAGALGLSPAAWSPGDALAANVVAAEAGLVAVGVARLAGHARPGAIGMIVGAATCAPMAWLAREIHVADELGVPTLGALHGLWLGALAPAILDGRALDGERAGLGALVGQGLGLGLGLTLATLTDVAPERIGWFHGGLGLGLAIGGGLALGSASWDPRARLGLTAGAGLALGLSLATFGDVLELDAMDPWILAAATATGLGSGLGLDRGAPGAPGREANVVGGELLLGASLGAVAGLALTQLVDASPTGFVRATTGASLLAGTMFSAATLGDLDPGLRQGLTVGLGTLGALALAPVVDALELGAPTIGAGAVGAASAAIWSLGLPTLLGRAPEAGSVIASLGLGGGLGALGSVALAQALRLDDTAPRTLAVASLAGLSLAGGTALLLPDAPGEARSWTTLGLGALGLGGGWWLTQQRFDGPALGGLALTLGVAGAGHGALLAPTWRSDAVRGSELAGGAIVGGTLGLVAGGAIERLTAAQLEPAVLGEAMSYAALGHAFGAGVGLMREDLRTAAFVMHGASALGLGLGLFLGDRTEWSLSELASSYVVAVATANASAWLGLAFDADPEGRPARVGGAALAGGALGAAIGGAYAQRTDGEGGEVGTYALAGATLGFGLERLLPRDARQARALTTGLSSLGALSLGLLAAPFVEHDLGDVTLVSTLGLLGAVHGGLFGHAHATDARGDAALTGTLVGTGAGLLAGLAASAAVDATGGDVVRAAFVAETFGLVGLGAAGLARADGTVAVGVVLPAAVALGAALSPIIAPHLLDAPGDVPPLLLATGALALEGAALGGVVDAPGASAGTQAGAALGVGLGVLGGAALGSWAPLEPLDALEVGLTWGIARTTAFGLGEVLGLAPGGGRVALESGLSLGALAASWALAPSSTWTPTQVGAGLELGAAGAWHGLLLGLAAAPTGAGGARGGSAALFGAGIGLLGGLALAQQVGYQASDLGEVAVGTLLGNTLGLGLSLSLGLDQTHPDAAVGLTAGAGLAALAGSLALTPHLSLGEERLATMGLFAGLGAAWGAPAPLLGRQGGFDAAEARPIGGAALVGGTLGLGVGALVDAVWAPDAVRREAIALGAGMGSATGLGLGLALSTDDRVGLALGQGLGALGAALVGATAEPRALTAGDLAVGTVWTAYLGWHQVGATLLLSGTDRQALGASLATLGVGALAGTYLVPRLRPTGEHALMLLAGSVWGSWIGGWGGQMLRTSLGLEGREGAGLLLTSAVLGSDLGLGLTGLVTSGLVDMSPTRFAIVNLAGLGGMVTGMLAAGFAKGEPLREGNVLGSLAGLALGTVVTAFFDLDPDPSPYEQNPSDAEATAPSGANAAVRVTQWMPSAGVEPGPSGEPRYMVSVSGTFE